MSRRCGGLSDQECRDRLCDPPMAWRRFSLKKLRLALSAVYGFGERVLLLMQGRLELHRHLSASGKPIPTVLITAYTDDGVWERALTAGVIGYLSKPFEEDDLLACIRSALGSDTRP